MMMIFCFAFLLVGFLRFTRAQQQAFQWNLTAALASSDGPSECETIHIDIRPLTPGSQIDAVPPFYMLSFELGGIGMTDYLGSDPQNLTYVVRHAQGTQILLYVVDSKGNSGEITDGIVQTGNNSNCHATTLTSSIEVAVDKSQVNTCDELTARITGGTKPYTVTVVGASSTNVSITNYTLGVEDGELLYVDRVSPGGNFIIAASDSTGQWAMGTNFLNSIGSTDTSCPGKQSSGSQSPNSTTTATPSNASDKGPVIGGVIGGIALLLVSAGGAAYFYFKRRKENLSAANQRAVPFDDDDFSPYVLRDQVNPGMQMQNNVPYALSSVTSALHSDSDTSDVPLLRNQYQSMRAQTVLTAGGVSSTSGSIYGMPGEPIPGNPHDSISRSISPGHIGSRSSTMQVVCHPDTASMSEKQRLAEERARAQQHNVIQHEDAEDIWTSLRCTGKGMDPLEAQGSEVPSLLDLPLDISKL